MNWFAMLLMAVGLAMDALAVALAQGLSGRRQLFRAAGRMALCFGLFQALMPPLGWLGGRELRGLIGGFDHWLAFGLLAVIGGRMVADACRHPAAPCQPGPPGWPRLLLLSVATSIDAFMAGVSLSLLGLPILGPALLIGAVTFALALLGGLAGGWAGRGAGRWAEALGGLILVGLGSAILVAHLR